MRDGSKFIRSFLYSIMILNLHIVLKMLWVNFSYNFLVISIYFVWILFSNLDLFPFHPTRVFCVNFTKIFYYFSLPVIFSNQMCIGNVLSMYIIVSITSMYIDFDILSKTFWLYLLKIHGFTRICFMRDIVFWTLK